MTPVFFETANPQIDSHCGANAYRLWRYGVAVPTAGYANANVGFPDGLRPKSRRWRSLPEGSGSRLRHVSLRNSFSARRSALAQPRLWRYGVAFLRNASRTPTPTACVVSCRRGCANGQDSETRQPPDPGFLSTNNSRSSTSSRNE
jgi:hypothetical protein